ncbi:MAG: SDR family oxidoreductase [Clostridiales Family XIII bacterium]|nr:SDR family oxidoreductase [Clostridiales Family XIII bacterium]
MFSLKGKNAVVTGAAAGIGRGIAVSLAKQGANVAVCDLPGVPADAARDEIASYGVLALTVEMDVSDEKMVNRGMDAVLSVFGGVDILCCNAGINSCESAEAISIESWDRHFDVNVRGALLPLRRAVPSMKEKKFGRIIFTSSQAALVGRPNQPAYCATKGALVSMARGLALDFAEFGITVNCVAPTFALTDISRKRMEDPAYREFVLGMIPMRRLAEVEDIGNTVVFLASEEAHMTTGAVITVDGGWTVR